MADDRRDVGAVELEEMGPVDYLVIEFPAGPPPERTFRSWSTWWTGGSIRILDLVLVKREFDGSMSLLALADADGDGEWDYSVFEGVSAGVLGRDDIDEAGQALEPGRRRPSWSTRTPGRRRWRSRCGAAGRRWWPAGASRSRRCWRRWTPTEAGGDRPLTAN